MQRFESLLDGGLVVPAMDLVEVDVIGSETLQARGRAPRRWLCGRGPGRWGLARMGAQTFVAMTTSSRGVSSVRARPVTLLAGAGRIDVGGVEEVDAEVERGLKKGRLSSSLRVQGQRRWWGAGLGSP